MNPQTNHYRYENVDFITTESLSESQHEFMKAFTRFGVIALPFWTWVKAHTSHGMNIDLTRTMKEVALFHGVLLDPLLSAAITCWDALNNEEKCGLGRLFDRPVRV